MFKGKDKNLILWNTITSTPEMAKENRERLEKVIEIKKVRKEKIKIKKAPKVKRTKAEKRDFRKTNAFLLSPEWRKIRYKTLKLADGCCQLCGMSYRKHGIILNVDHIKPRKHYPNLALSLSNLQVLCEACNHGKGNTDQTDWRN